MTNKSIRISFGDQFVKDLKHLKKKYPHIRYDIESLIERLQNGEIPGDQIQATKYTVYKVRLRSSDLNKGKSGGYRVIYFIQMPTEVALITIYVKSERVDLSHEIIKQFVEEYLDTQQ
jgi:mRNA-degrading endonuclease RelE of RelBE toxin-antitoxin system